MSLHSPNATTLNQSTEFTELAEHHATLRHVDVDLQYTNKTKQVAFVIRDVRLLKFWRTTVRVEKLWRVYTQTPAIQNPAHVLRQVSR